MSEEPGGELETTTLLEAQSLAQHLTCPLVIGADSSCDAPLLRDPIRLVYRCKWGHQWTML